MPDWSTLVKHARSWNSQLCAHLGYSTPKLLNARELLDTASKKTGWPVLELPDNDQLLEGAVGVFSKDMSYILVRNSLDPPIWNFVVAHEFGHFNLHSDVDVDRLYEPALMAAFNEVDSAGVTHVEPAYSPEEKREREANLFARELLMPAPLVRAAYLNEGLSCEEIADRIGLPETMVLQQLISALLTPEDDDDHERDELPTVPPLDASQLAAARAQERRVVVRSGPGTGKTLTLATRIQYLVEERDVPPEAIAALTFSNRAANEIGHRLVPVLGSRAHLPWVGTFHAFGLEILRQEGGAIGISDTPRVLGIPQAVKLLLEHIDGLGLRYLAMLNSPEIPLIDILKCISLAKSRGVDHEEYRRLADAEISEAVDDTSRQKARRSQEAAAVYEQYERLLRAKGLLDFGDLIMLPIKLLEQHAEIRHRLQRRFTCLVADEVQDVSPAVASLLSKLDAPNGSQWLVGDHQQAIYHFQGAGDGLLLHEGETDQAAYNLSTNYRSVPQLVTVVSTLTTPATEFGAVRQTKSHAGAFIAQPETEAHQSAVIARLVREYSQKGYPPGSQAVLCRTNRDAAHIAQSLEDAGIATSHTGQLFRRTEIRQLMALLELSVGQLSSVRAAVGLYDCALGDESLQAAEHAIIRARSLHADGDSHDEGYLLSADTSAIANSLAVTCERLDGMGTWHFLARFIVDQRQFIARLLSGPTQHVLPSCTAVKALLQIAAAAHNVETGMSATEQRKDFLLQARIMILDGADASSPASPVQPDGDVLNIMTIHQAKGLEFDVVYVPNLNEKQFSTPHNTAMVQVPKELRFEDNLSKLFYVAVSRARDAVILLSPISYRSRCEQPIAPCHHIAPLSGILTDRTADWLDEPIILDTRSGWAVPVPHGNGVGLRALEQFEKCPRRFAYAHLVKLPTKRTTSEYRELWNAMRIGLLSWGARDSPCNSIAELYAADCSSRPNGSTSMQRYLLAAARDMDKTLANLQPPSGQILSEPISVDIGGLAITVPVTIGWFEPGIRAEVWHIDMSVPSPESQDNAHMMLQYAVSQFTGLPVKDVVARYVNLREDAPGKPKKWTKHGTNRLEKLTAIAEHILAPTVETFQPQPNEMKCATCPYLYVCDTRA